MPGLEFRQKPVCGFACVSIDNFIDICAFVGTDLPLQSPLLWNNPKMGRLKRSEDFASTK